MISVRSRRSRPSRRPRKQQQGQAPGTASAEATGKAATAANDQAPDTAGSHMPQQAHKRARMEAVQALAETGAGSQQQASAPRPVQAFTPVNLPQRLSTPEAAEIRRDMTAQNAPGTLHSFHAAGSQTPQPTSQQQSSPLLTPGQRHIPSALKSLVLRSLVPMQLRLLRWLLLLFRECSSSQKTLLHAFCACSRTLCKQPTPSCASKVLTGWQAEPCCGLTGAARCWAKGFA